MLNWLTNVFKLNRLTKPETMLPEFPENSGRLTCESGECAQKRCGDDCLEAGDWHGAEMYYRHAIAIAPCYAVAYNNLGLALMEQERLEEAEASIRQALVLDETLFNSCYILGMVAHRRGNPRAALDCYRRAAEINPHFSEAFSCAGDMLSEIGDSHAAGQSYLHAIALNPGVAEIYCNYAGIAQVAGRTREAIEYYRRALHLSPACDTARLSLIHQMQQICEWDSIEPNIDLVRQHILEAPDDLNSRVSPFSFLALPGATAQEQKVCAEKWARSAYRLQIRLREKLGFSFGRKPNHKIKIGYLSADFHQHATAMLMAEIFELHDRNRFHVAAYSYGPDDGSGMRRRLRSAFDEFFDIENESIIDSAKRIYEDRIDILVDLKGYTGGSRSAILALRPAPIQINFLGYPGTMGADFVDYLLADRYIIPQESKQYYSEKILYLPDCYQPNDRTRPRPPAPTRLSLQLPENGIVFCCFNQIYKITPEMFDIWCRLLLATPGSMLWLLHQHPDAETNLRREACRRGVSGDRLAFALRAPAEEHLARLQCADIFLDTFPYNAHTTCSESLWMGLPLVTYSGETFSSRVAGSLLSALNVPELITINPTDYFDLALKLANNHEWRLAIRNKILMNSSAAPLFDSRRFARNLEIAYESALNSRVEYAFICK